MFLLLLYLHYVLLVFSAIIAILVVICIIIIITAWFIFAYMNPNTKSGMWLIEVSHNLHHSCHLIPIQLDRLLYIVAIIQRTVRTKGIQL